jgi:hypothetical protein
MGALDLFRVMPQDPAGAGRTPDPARPSARARKAPRVPLSSFPTLAIAVAVLLFVAWISLAAHGPKSLYIDRSPTSAAGFPVKLMGDAGR